MFLPLKPPTAGHPCPYMYFECYKSKIGYPEPHKSVPILNCKLDLPKILACLLPPIILQLGVL